MHSFPEESLYFLVVVDVGGDDDGFASDAPLGAVGGGPEYGFDLVVVADVGDFVHANVGGEDGEVGGEDGGVEGGWVVRVGGEGGPEAAEDAGSGAGGGVVGCCEDEAWDGH